MTSIPINTSSAACFIITKASDVNKMLLLKRAGEGYWCHVAGKIESNETAINAVIREVKEETGLVISELFSADYIIQFYDVGINTFF